MGHDGVHQLFVLGDGSLHHFADAVILGKKTGHIHELHGACVDELRGDLIAGDGQDAYVGQLGAGGGMDHLVALLVLDGDEILSIRKLEIGVRMAVQHHIDTGGVHDDLGSRPRRALVIHTQVGQGDHVVGAFSTGGVHGLLDLVVQVLAVVAFAEGIDEVAFPILEVLGRGLGKGFRRIDAHEGDLLAGLLDDGVGLQNSGALIIKEVAADILELGQTHVLLELVHAVIELMVANGGHVVAHIVHELHDGFALAEGTDDVALDSVAIVHQDDFLAGSLKGGLHAGDAHIAHTIGDTAVHIVGVEDHDLLRGLLPFGLGGGGHNDHAQQHHDSQQTSKYFLVHSFPPC